MAMKVGTDLLSYLRRIYIIKESMKISPCTPDTTAFGQPVWGTAQTGDLAQTNPLDPLWGTSNYCFTLLLYYYGESWCDLIFYANETKKYTLEEIMSGSQQFPYYTRFWHPGVQDTLRDLTGYKSTNATGFITEGPYKKYNLSPWRQLFDIDNSTATINSLPDGDPNPDASGTSQPNWASTGLSAFKWKNGSVMLNYWNGSSNTDRYTMPPQHTLQMLIVMLCNSILP